MTKSNLSVLNVAVVRREVSISGKYLFEISHFTEKYNMITHYGFIYFFSATTNNDISYTFSSIEKNEYSKLYDYLKSKKVNVKASGGGKSGTLNWDEDDKVDHYLEGKKNNDLLKQHFYFVFLFKNRTITRVKSLLESWGTTFLPD